MDYFNATLKQAEENGDKNFIGWSLNDIGILYYDKYDYDKALEYYTKSEILSQGDDVNKLLVLRLMNKAIKVVTEVITVLDSVSLIDLL